MLFCDLVGSTSLAARLDPEDLRDLVRVYHARCEKIVREFDGSVAQFLGDGVMARFGYPTAHEDDAERAIRCGLEMINAVRELGTLTGPQLEVRVGIATGVVVVGDQLSSEPTQERAAVGETPNLAARLQSLAQPGSLVIADRTKKLIGNLFDCQDIGSVSVKGYGEPIQAWHVRGLGKVESRFEALRSGDAPLIGREEEIELLRRRWAQAKSGEGRVILLCGQPGIGKSRLVATFQDGIAGEPHARLRYFFSPYHQSSALYPVISQLGHAARFERDDDATVLLAKLDTLLARTSTTPEDAALIADLLSLPAASRYPPLDLTPQQRKNKTLQALVRRIQALADAQPVLIVFEDAHWSDPSSREFLDLVIERIQSLPALLVVTFRPEFEPPWTGQSRVSTLVLNQLDRRDGAALVKRIVSNETLSEEVVEDIVKRADGVPLFVEELAKLVLEIQVRPQDPVPTLATTPSTGLAVPETLHGSLLARLDRLGSARDIGQMAAAIGREFSFDILCAVADQRSEEIQASLDKLVNAGLFFQRGAPPHASYFFKHVLIQDAAYGSLLRARRHELHARIASILERQFSEICETQPEVLARHYTQAGLAGPAIDYWQRAGDRAAKRSANQEAVAHLRKALELVEALPDTAARTERELQILIALGPTLMTTRSSAAPEIGRVYARARELAQNTPRAGDLFPTVAGAWLFAFAAGDLATASRLVEELFELARDDSDSGLMLQAHHAAWPTFMVAGAIATARQHTAAGLALYRRDAHAEQALQYHGHDAGACGYVTDALMAAVLGYPDQAVQQMDKGVALARDLAHVPTLNHVLSFAAEVHQICREPQKVQDLVAVAFPLLSKHGSAVGVANATMLRGWARVMQGHIDEGLATMQDGLAAWRATGSKVWIPHRLTRAADAYWKAGNIEEGLRLVDEATQCSNDRWLAPEPHRLRGELLLSAGRRDEAEQCFQQAILVAREQSARLLELRAATRLGRLWHDRGRRAEARDLLAPIYAWFTEGFEMPDLKEAKALLDQLA